MLTDRLSSGYYHWYGSLTTPPCTEGVSWNLLKVPEKVCQRQVDALRRALSTTQDGVSFSNRVVQPLNHRVVSETGTPGKPIQNVLLCGSDCQGQGQGQGQGGLLVAILVLSCLAFAWAIIRNQKHHAYHDCQLQDLRALLKTQQAEDLEEQGSNIRSQGFREKAKAKQMHGVLGSPTASRSLIPLEHSGVHAPSQKIRQQRSCMSSAVGKLCGAGSL
ncbi:unnamed protein product [Polarella glacialis]|uniref:carbonic anhydrase n=1 Tax=Polarella glacialis TaxID=89957 RepID=A0A813KLL4_POLGL|nr:unnamed protein product [Polarella glacialis]